MLEKIVGAWNQKLVTWSKTAPDTGPRDLCTAYVKKTGSSNLRRTTSLSPWVGLEVVVYIYPSRDNNCKIKHLCSPCQSKDLTKFSNQWGHCHKRKHSIRLR